MKEEEYLEIKNILEKKLAEIIKREKKIEIKFDSPDLDKYDRLMIFEGGAFTVTAKVQNEDLFITGICNTNPFYFSSKKDVEIICYRIS